MTFAKFIFCFILTLIARQVSAQTKDIKLGAYYFDGWTGAYPYHITDKLVNEFPERKPVWGWLTSTQTIIDKQIQLANNAGLSFFSFCWYYKGKNDFKSEPLNRALGLYLNSDYKYKLKYNLLVVNHKGFAIGPKDWDLLTNAWISYFKSATYLRVDNKPIITFFTLRGLLTEFGSVDKVKEAFNSLKIKAKLAGLEGVTIAVCSHPNEKDVKLAADCGVDVLTGYNYQDAGFTIKQNQIPIDSLQNGEYRYWNRFKQISNLVYMPVSTINWDPRPWANAENGYDNKPYYTGFSQASVKRSITKSINWLNNNANRTTKERIILLYAWNEYGEGAWLTPSTNDTLNLLNGIKQALTNK
jgi:hypothetical protein